MFKNHIKLKNLKNIMIAVVSPQLRQTKAKEISQILPFFLTFA